MIAEASPESRIEAALRPPGRTLQATIELELKAGLAIDEVERRIALARRAGDVGARVLAFYLVDLAERGAHQEQGYRSVELFAEMRFGLRPSTTREHLAIGRALEELPALDEAFCAEKLLWSQVRLIARIATPQTESAWIAWAQGRTVRDLVAQVRNREKGDLPTDPQKRQIHTTHFTVQGRFNALQMELWNTAREKLEAESGRPVSDADMMLEIARLVLDTRPDGSVPGRRPVNDGHFKVVIRHDEATGRTAVDTADGPVVLDGPAACEVDARASNDPPEDAEIGDSSENSGPEVPPAERDRPTPPAMLAEVLARDGYRCRCCKARFKPSGHHKKWRRYGGRTEPRNLMTECEDCHSLTHDRLLVVRGRVPDALRFTDANGRELTDRADPADVTMEAPPVVARATTGAIVEYTQLPAEVDMAWWARNGHLLHWSERRGFEFRAGPSREPGRDGSVARAAPQERLSGLVGHERIRRSLATSAMAALKTGRPAPHVLLAGPPGLGKTSLARAMAGELGRPFRATSGPAMEEIGVLVRLLTTLSEGEVVFIDELHRMPARVCEMLYEAMEDGTLSLPVSCGSRATTIRVRLHPFTLIGATSEVARLPAPFHSRFVYREHLTFYGMAEITEILRRAARGDGFELSLGAARRLARASRDTPREAVALLAALREEASLTGCTAASDAVAREVLDRLGVDPDGLTPQEREYLGVLREASRPLGRKALAKRLGVSPSVVDDAYEPFPARRGMVEFTRYGRVLAS